MTRLLSPMFAATAVVGAVLLAGPALASVQVIGDNAARDCFEAADAENLSIYSVASCDRALDEGNLTRGDEVATYVNRGILRMRADNISGALSDFDAAIARDANQPEAYLNKGVALTKQEGWKEAAPFFTMALDRGTRKPALAHLGRGMAYEMSGDVKSAYRDYKQANAIEPKWAVPMRELARFSVVRQ